MRYKEMAVPAPETTIYKTAADHLRSKGLKAKDPQRATVLKTLKMLLGK